MAASGQQGQRVFVRVFVCLGQGQALIEHPARFVEFALHGQQDAAFAHRPRDVIAGDTGGPQRLTHGSLGPAHHQLAAPGSQRAAPFHLHAAAGRQPGQHGDGVHGFDPRLLDDLHRPFQRRTGLVQLLRVQAPHAFGQQHLRDALGIVAFPGQLARHDFFGNRAAGGARPDVQDDPGGHLVTQFQPRPVVPLRFLYRALQVTQMIE